MSKYDCFSYTDQCSMSKTMLSTPRCSPSRMLPSPNRSQDNHEVPEEFSGPSPRFERVGHRTREEMSYRKGSDERKRVLRNVVVRSKNEEFSETWSYGQVHTFPTQIRNLVHLSSVLVKVVYCLIILNVTLDLSRVRSGTRVEELSTGRDQSNNILKVHSISCIE